MDKLRRSFRKSFHIGQKSRLTQNEHGRSHSPTHEMPVQSIGAGAKPNAFQPDETSVRNGTCHFQVKYLGSCEVFESRGMEVCEHALKHLRSKNRAVKAVLYVSGDSLRVVDQESNRGLIVDQTVEKVSFCAPDRSNDKGFAYICRDGATKRWMCHGFIAAKESGERLSHAVGCSFAICLEKKRKREAEMAVFLSAKNLADEVNADISTFSHRNQAYSSFRRQLSLAERRQDPQKAILADPPPLSSNTPVNLFDMSPDTPDKTSFEGPASATPRPQSTSFERQQSSFRAAPNLPQFGTNNEQFRRFNSLRTDLNGKPVGTLKSLHNEPIYEGDEEWPGSAQQQNSSTTKPTTTRILTSNSINEFLSNLSNDKENGVNVNGWPRSQSAVPQTLSESTSQHADQWLADILQATSVSATTSTTQSTLQSNFNNYQTTSGPPPSQPPPPLPPTQVLQTPQKSIFQAEVSSNYIAPTAVLSSRTTPQVTPQLTIQPTPLHSYTSPSTSTAESTSTTTDFLQPQRRSSADKRKSIEYQILEETDAPPQSPPRITSPIVANGSNGKVEVDVFGQTVFNPTFTQKPEPAPRQVKVEKIDVSNNLEKDPFDVQWTDEVLESARSSKLSPLSRNPFTQESAPVNV